MQSEAAEQSIEIQLAGAYELVEIPEEFQQSRTKKFRNDSKAMRCQSPRRLRQEHLLPAQP